MTADEEETLAGGKNFEHSFGAIQTGKLEMMIKMYRRYLIIKPELDKKIGVRVNLFYLLCFSINIQIRMSQIKFWHIISVFLILKSTRFWGIPTLTTPGISIVITFI